jgi:hypothetical protein
MEPFRKQRLLHIVAQEELEALQEYHAHQFDEC